MGPATIQSPFVATSGAWKSAFEQAGAKAIINVWHNFDSDSGRGVSRLIRNTGIYESVAKIDNGVPREGKGFELFIAQP
jgi:hypothetical protein